MASESIESIGSLPRHSLLALVWTSFSAACLFVILRTAIRFKFAARRRPSGEDYWVWLALAALLTLCILQTIQLSSLYFITAVMKGALPVKEYSKLIPTTENYLRFQFPIVVLFWTVLWCIKAAFLALYFKLFRELTLYRRVWYVLATFTFLAYVGCIITLSLSCGGKIANFFKFAQCGQPEDIWASNVSIYYSTSVDIFTDLCIMAMPLKLIYNVKISRKQKMGLVCVFGLCFVMIAFAIIRAKQVLVPQNFVNLSLLMIWSTLAASISVIVGSLPALKIFLTSRGSTRRSRNNSSSARRNQPFSNNVSVRSKSIPLGSVSSDKKSSSGRCPGTAESQEDMLQADGAQFVMVKHDITVSFDEVDHPHPVYQNHQPVPPYRNAI